MVLDEHGRHRVDRGREFEQAEVTEERERRGVTAHVQDDDVSVTLYVSVEYGYPIQDVARTLQAHVKGEIEEMTGLRVQGVHIYVSDLTLPEGAWPHEQDAGVPIASPQSDDEGSADSNGDEESRSRSASELRGRS